MGLVSDILAAERVPPRRRFVLALALGLVCAWAAWHAMHVLHEHTDFGQVWASARAILHAQNPYEVVGPNGILYQWRWPLMYPLPAGVAAIPLAPFSEAIATAIFGGIAGGVFAWTLMEHGYAPMAGYFSASLLAAVSSGQWSPLLAGAATLPAIGILFVCKPTVGAVYFAYRPSRIAIVGGLWLVALATFLEPTWPMDWLAAIRENARIWAPDVSYRPIVGEAGGVLALACLARWRRPEARLVAVLACVPLTPMPYETVALFLVPRRAGEAALLAAVSWGLQFWLDAVIPGIPTFGGRYDYTAQALALTMYPLATLMVLRRPNEGPAPAWLETRASTWPTWLRGARA